MELTLTVEFSDDVKKLLTKLTQSLSKLSNGEESEDDDDDTEEEDEPAPKKKAAPAKKGKKVVEEDEGEDDDDDDTDDDDDDSEGYTQERVREKAQQLIQAGKAPKLKALLGEFGYQKVVQLKPKDFDKFMAKANKIK